MNRMMAAVVALAALLPVPADGQEPPVPVVDTSLHSILTVIRGEAGPELLHKKRGESGWCCLGFGFAARVLTQYTGPELGTNWPGGHRSQAELDAFAEELVAIALTARPIEEWGDQGDSIAAEVRLAFLSAADPRDPHSIPYSKAYDALLRIYEAGRGRPDDLINTDPVRGVRHMLDLAQARKLTQFQFCTVLAMAHPHGRIVAEKDGTLSFELGGLYSSQLTRDVFEDVGGERFVEIDTPGVAPCYWVALRPRKK